MKGNDAKKEFDYHALVINRILTTVLVSVIPMLLAAGVILYQFRMSYQEKTREHLTTLMRKHKQNIDNFLHERLDDIVFFSERSTFEEVANDGYMEETLGILQGGVGRVFVDLGLVDERGVQRTYAGPYRLGRAVYGEAEWFKLALHKDFFISDVFLGLRGLPHFIVAVKHEWEGRDWILRATIDFGAFNDLVENIRIGKTGFAFILNREGEFQTQPVFELMADRELYQELLQGEPSDGGVLIKEQADSQGRKNLYAATFLKNGDWMLVYQQRVTEAFADVRRAMQVGAFIVLLGTLSSIGLAVLRVKTMAARLAEVEHEKELMNEQILETGKLASVGELAAGIAHEINNPVAIMAEEAGWIEDLLEDVPDDNENLPEIRRALTQIRSQGKRCKEITHKLLSFARRTDSTVQEVDLKELIEEIVEISAQRSRYGNAVIKVDLKDDLPHIQASPTEIQQVMLNLINNAIDAVEKGGGTIDIHAYKAEDEIILVVADSGRGIPKANLNKIFDPFFTTKQVGKGTGLGLSICYGIIQKMGGRIEVDSVLGQGTRFTIHLPVGGAEEEGPQLMSA